jgi:uncharacterized protein YfaT (DUF1175 family)
MTDYPTVTTIDLTVPPTEDTLYAVYAWLYANGYSAAVFTPDELGETSPDAVMDKMIDAGWTQIHGDVDAYVIAINPNT